MAKSYRFLLISAALAVFAVSCSTTRILEDGQYRLVKNEIKVSNDKGFNPKKLEPYIKQKPNKGLALAVYNFSRKENSFWHRIGKAPVVYDHALVESSVDNMLRHLEYLGY